MVDAEAELDCAQMGAIVLPMALGSVVVGGPDRLSWLNGLVTCDLAKKSPGDAAYGLVVSKAGKIQSEIHVLVGESDLWVGVRADKAAAIAEDLDRHLVMENAEVAPADPALVWFAALGPRAKSAVHAAREAGARAGLVSRGGLPAAIVAAPASRADAVVASIVSTATPSMVASAEGWNRIRVEHGIPEYGVDFDDTNYPQEASLERDAVSFTKGCYLGQETVFMLEKRGHVKKKLVQILVRGPVRPGAVITLPDGTELGKVTSAVERPGGNLALGWVKYKQAKGETELRVADAPAVVTHLMEIRDEESSSRTST